MSRFNLKQFKHAERGREPPQVFTRPFFRKERDAYDLYHGPDDGRGYKRTTPGTEGLPGQPGGISSPFGSRGRSNSPEPDDYSEFGSNSDRPSPREDPNKELPSDTDPPMPFYDEFPSETRTEYDEGQETGYGQAQHDGTNRQRADVATSMEETVKREMGPSSYLDRSPAITSMPSGYNSMYSRDKGRTPFFRVRNNKRST